jgi:hypothetical protein
LEPVFWNVTLNGAHAGVNSINISPTRGNLNRNLETEMKKHKIKYEIYKCDTEREASYGEIIYKVKFPKKKPAWIYYEYSSGSDGYSGEFTIFLRKEIVDDAYPELTTSCEKVK